MNNLTLVYVFDYRNTDGYRCRVPVFVARQLCKVWSFHDYAPLQSGL